MKKAEYVDDIELLTSTPAQFKYMQHKLEQAASGIGIVLISDKTEFKCVKQHGTIFTVNSKSTRLVWFVLV